VLKVASTKKKIYTCYTYIYIHLYTLHIHLYMLYIHVYMYINFILVSQLHDSVIFLEKVK